MTLQFPYARLLIVVFSIASIPLMGCSVKKHSIDHSTKGAPVNIDRLDEGILQLVNKYRQTKSLAALQMNEVISAEAEKHSMAMANKKTAFGHDGFEERIKLIKAKLGFLGTSAENVAFGNLTAREVVDIWLKSPAHKRNIEGKFTLTGIGVAKDGNGTLFFTQIFTTK